MAISNQIKILKENWLIIIGLVVIILIVNSGSEILSLSKTYGSLPSMAVDSGMSYAEGVSSQRYMGEDFAPESDERKITRTVSSSIEVKRGKFETASISLKNYISKSEGILINENINSVGEGISKRKTGSYSIKIPVEQYEDFIFKVKNLGEVQNFNDNLLDITSDYLNTEESIELEKARLKRYEELFQSSKSIEEKLSLTDRIFQQERTIKYLEDSLERKEQKIEYVTVYLNINEKQSSFIGISIVNIGKIAKSFMNSLNNIIILIAWLIPWIIVVFLGKIIWKRFKK